MRSRDWTEGSIVRNLWSLSWPVMIANSLYTVMQVFDMFWVGRLGATPMAGVGIASIIVMFVLSVMMGLAVGVRAMVARFVGAGDVDGASRVARQGFVISAVYGVVMTIVGVSLAEPILRLFGVEAGVVTAGAAYMRIVFISWAPMAFSLMAYSIMQASGDTQTPMRIAFFWTVVHIVLSPFLIFGWWVFPRMGVSGAAVANAVTQGLAGFLGTWILFSGRTRLRLTMSDFRVDFGVIGRMLKIGIPATIMSMERSLGQLVLMRFITPFGTFAVAAHSLTQRIQQVLFMPGSGLGMGAGVLVGQNLGAGKPERAERSGWMAVVMVESVMVVSSVVILLKAESIVSLFNTEPDLVAVASIFLRIAAAGGFVQGFTGVLQNSISGAGDTVPPMVVSLVAMWVVQFPLAYFLPQVTDLGVYGVRWAMVASVVIGAVFYTIYFRMGRWKRKKV